MDAEIDTEADDKSALTHEQREKQEAEVQSDLLSVERDESALVWSAMEQRLPVEHRADISPEALLGVVSVVAPRIEANGGSSPGLSWVRR